MRPGGPSTDSSEVCWSQAGMTSCGVLWYLSLSVYLAHWTHVWEISVSSFSCCEIVLDFYNDVTQVFSDRRWTCINLLHNIKRKGASFSCWDSDSYGPVFVVALLLTGLIEAAVGRKITYSFILCGCHKNLMFAVDTVTFCCRYAQL